MTALERYALEAILCLAAVFGIVTYLEHRGAAKYEAADKAVAVKAEAHNAAIEATDTQAINSEAIAHDKAIADAPDPTPALVCVRKYALSRAVPGNPTTAPLRDAAPALPAASGPSFDPGPQLAKIGQAADAQVAELQSYVHDVCLNSGANPK
jgi:hypothetical protein